MHELFNELLNKKITISVVGDTLIDEFYKVNVNRISPEFPIPVMLSNSGNPYKTVCGGAANVANQFKYFNIDTKLVSFLNFYAKELCDAEGIDISHSHECDTCQVPIKKRFYHDDHPIMRWDVEAKNYGVDNLAQQLKNLNPPESDVVIYSDYDKGLFTKKFNMTGNGISLVDPKIDVSLWNKCSVFKQNYHEAVRITGEKDIKKQIDKIIKKLKCEQVVITKSGEGVFGYSKEEGYVEVIPENELPKPVSVSGAGDAFAGFLAMGLGCGFSLKQSMTWAFNAGTIYVSNKYNQPLCMADFLRKEKYVKNWEFLANRNFKLVVTGGCFDVLHKGHMHSLREAKKHGDRLCVTLNSDESIKRLKGPKRPIMPLESRIEVLKSLEFVDYIVVFESNTPEDVLKVLKPDVYVKGTDYKNKELHGSEYVKRVVLVDLVEGYSTTKFLGGG
jgi:D-beta-D-heptose 7-phosphate kinase/D-beta-D-heptose 1-phosphate adenosyltransferase